MTSPLRPAILLLLSLPLAASTGCSAATTAGEPTPAAAAEPAPAAAESRWTWTGFEIVGQQQHTREEIAALLPVELGTPYPEDRAILDRCNEILRAELDVAHIACSNVLFSTGEAYLVVEVVEHGEEERRDFRPAPAGDAPLAPELAALYDRLIGSLMAAFREGAEVGENMDAGCLDYRHPELHALVEEMRRVVPPRREELLRVLAENPEGANRARAAWLLNWAGDEADTIARVLPALDDPHGVTRNDVTRFLLHYVDRLEDEATLRALVDALARQLSRPSHGDRNKAAYSLGSEILRPSSKSVTKSSAVTATDWIATIRGSALKVVIPAPSKARLVLLDEPADLVQLRTPEPAASSPGRGRPSRPDRHARRAREAARHRRRRRRRTDRVLCESRRHPPSLEKTTLRPNRL